MSSFSTFGSGCGGRGSRRGGDGGDGGDGGLLGNFEVEVEVELEATGTVPVEAAAPVEAAHEAYVLVAGGGVDFVGDAEVVVEDAPAGAEFGGRGVES